MGSYFDSVVIPGNHQAAVRELAVQWMKRKGFELLPREPLFGNLEGHERGIVVSANPNGTAVFLSEAGESEQLIKELRQLNQPVLRLWLVSSDFWGYQLTDNQHNKATFSSNRSHSGPGQQLEIDLRGDPLFLARAFKVPGKARELARIQRRKELYAERIVEEFCEVLGIRMAASQFKYCINEEPREPAGSERLLFAKAAQETVSNISGPLARLDPRVQLKPVERQEPSLRMMLIDTLVVRPFLAQRWLRKKLTKQAAAPAPVWFRTEGSRLTSDRYRFAITLPAGAAPCNGPPAGDAIAFKVEGVRVSVRAQPHVRAQTYLEVPAEAEVQLDAPEPLNGWQRRKLRYSSRGKVTHFELVETPGALLAFVCRDASNPAIANAISAAAASLQLI